MLRPRYVLAVVAAVLLLSRCDMPTESPSFSFDTQIKSPLLYETSYQLMGSPDSNTDVLIDTTAGGLDTLFTASGTDNTISVTRSVDDFDIGSMDDVIPELTVDPVSFAVSGEAAVGKKAGKTGKQAAGTVTFTEEGSFSLDLDEVSFDNADDYVALDGGHLVIQELINEWDVDFKRLSIIIPSLRTAPYGEDDGVQITFSQSKSAEDDFHFPALKANETRRDIEIPLADLRLFPTDNKISYTVDGETEEVTGFGVIDPDDEIKGTLGIEDISFQKVQATVAATTVDLTADADDDGQIEIMNDAEAQIATIDGLDDLNDWFSSFELTGTQLELKIETNLPANAELYAAVRGESAAGESVYLRGRNDYSVRSGEVSDALFTGKTGPLNQSKLIKIPVESSADPTSTGLRTISVVLDGNTSNVDEFLNTLPTEIRFIGRARINPDGPRRMALTRPVELDASLEAYLPLKISGEALTVNDTMEADFSDLKDATSSGESLQFREGSLEVVYQNGFPVGANLKLEVLDADHRPIGVAFGGEESPITIEPASVENGYAAAAADGRIELNLTEDQLDILDRGRYLKHELIVRSDASSPVSLRADDHINLKVHGSFGMRISTD